MGRPKKNKDILIGRAGRNAIEREDIERFSSMATPKANNRTIQGKLIAIRAANYSTTNKKISGSDFGESMRA
jgi:hypothetical protein